MQLLTEKLEFEKIAWSYEDEEIPFDLYRAATQDYFYGAKVMGSHVKFTVHSSPNDNGTVAKPLYAFTYDLSSNKEIKRYTEVLPNLLGLDTYEREMLNHNIASHFFDIVIEERERKINQTQVCLFDKKGNNRQRKSPIFLQVPKEKDQTRKNLKLDVRMSNELASLKKPLLGNIEMKVIMNIMDKKESVMYAAHLLDATDRSNFIQTWGEFSDLMELSKQLANDYTVEQQSDVLRKLNSLVANIFALDKIAKRLQEQPQENMEVSILSAKVEKVQSQLAESNYVYDLVVEHRLSTIKSDYLQLMDLYRHSHPRNRKHLEAEVIAGLTEVISKLKIIEMMALDQEERSIQRQVILIRER